jgi:hypothetical protein
VHLCIPNNFCNSFFFSFHIKMHFPFFRWPEGSKQVLFCEGATKGSMENITALIFRGGGPTRGATSRSLGIILACCHIMNYFCPKSILIQFCTAATRNAHQKNWGKIHGGPLGCGTLEPRPNHGSHPSWQTSMAPRV